MRITFQLPSRHRELGLIALIMTSHALFVSKDALAQSWILETADPSSNNVAYHTSLALDAFGNPHVSYQDATDDDLKYARKSWGVWIRETADGSANDVGTYTSLALDTAGNPRVSYHDETANDLMYARKSGDVWFIERVDGLLSSVGAYSSLALDASGNIHVSYEDANAGALKYARRVGASWTLETADGSANDVGAHTSLALDTSGNPHVSYYDQTTGSLKYARKSGGVWTIETADGSLNDVGLYASLALDASGNPHVSYHDATIRGLKYARKSGGVWTRELVDESEDPLPSGLYTSLALDALGNSHVSYYDQSTGSLKYARKAGGVWTIERPSGLGTGAYPSLALDASGSPHITHRDFSAGDLAYAYIPSGIVGSPGSGATWVVGSLQTISWSYTGGLATDISDVYLSVDGGGSFALIEDNTRDFTVTIRVPHLPTRFARIKVVQPSPFMVGRSDSFFTIDATIALAKFDASRDASGDGTRLTWETRPGPEADIGYRVERASSDAGLFSPIHGDLLDVSEILDPTPVSASASRYRLIAVNGLGEEYVLGETSVAPALAADRDIVAYPNPANASVQILFRVPTDRASSLEIYDASGRRIRSLASGSMPVGIQSATWDRKDDNGRDVAPGTYFLRLTSANGYQVTQRVTIVR